MWFNSFSPIRYPSAFLVPYARGSRVRRRIAAIQMSANSCIPVLHSMFSTAVLPPPGGVIPSLAIALAPAEV